MQSKGMQAIWMNERSQISVERGGAELDIYYGDNLEILQNFEEVIFDLTYSNPPFNSGRVQRRRRMKRVRDEAGDRVGYQGRRYRTIVLGSKSFNDVFSDYWEFLGPRLDEAYRLLSPTGSFFLHLDYREIHRSEERRVGRQCRCVE